MGRQDAGLLLIGLAAVPLAYAFGLFDWVGGVVNPPRAPPQHGPRGNLHILLARRPDGSPVQYCAPLGNDSATLLVQTPDGRGLQGASVFVALGGATPPAQSEYRYVGDTFDPNGTFGLEWGSTATAYFYASDPAGVYGDSGVLRVC